MVFEATDAVLLLHGFRTGSNYLSNALQNHGIGWPAEHFNQSWQAKVDLLSGDELYEHFRSTVASNVRNGVFACKLPLQDLCWVARVSGDWGDPIDSLAKKFRRCAVVYLYRKDVFSQAVSFWRAQATGEWQRAAGAIRSHVDPEYSGFDIYNNYVMLARDSLVWEELLRRSETNVVRESYETLVSKPQALNQLGDRIIEIIDPSAEKFQRPANLVSRHIKQGDELSERFREEFVIELVKSYGGLRMKSDPANIG